MAMQNIWSRKSETGLAPEEYREQLELHLLWHLGEAHTAFSDQDGWAGKSREPGPPVDVLVVPPEGERRFAYVCTLGCGLKKAGDALDPAGRQRLEFVMAAPQTGKDGKDDLAMLNLAANTVRQFAKLVHVQPVRVRAGETVQFSQKPQPMFEGSKQVAFAFAAPRLPNQGFETLKLPGGEKVTFIAPVPIYLGELLAARRKGPAALDRALTASGATEMLDLERPSMARGGLMGRLFGGFRRTPRARRRR